MKIYPNFDEVLWPFSKIQVREKRNWSRWSHSTSDQSAIEQTFRKPLILEYNLAYACPDCNVNKGSDIGTILQIGGNLVPFFHPRRDTWIDHFELLQTGEIRPKTEVGAATIKILGLNYPDIVSERKMLLDAKLW